MRFDLSKEQLQHEAHVTNPKFKLGPQQLDTMTALLRIRADVDRTGSTEFWCQVMGAEDVMTRTLRGPFHAAGDAS